MSESLAKLHPEEGPQKLKEVSDTTDGSTVTKAEVLGGSTIVIANRLNHLGEAQHTDVVRIPEVGTTLNIHAHGKDYVATVEKIVSSDKGVNVIVRAPDDYPDPTITDGKPKRYAFTPQEFSELSGEPTPAGKTTPQINNAEPVVQDKLKDLAAAYESIKDDAYENINDVITRFADREVPQDIIKAQLLAVKMDLEAAGLANKYSEIAPIIEQFFADHKEYVTPEVTNDPKNQIKNISEAELTELKKLNPNEFATKVAEQLITQFPNQPIPERIISEQQLVGARYETSWGSVNRRTNKKNEVADKIGQVLRQHNEDVFPIIEQKLTQQLDNLLSIAGNQRLTVEALAPFTQELATLTINNATESYIRLRQKLDAKISAHNNKALDTAIASTESKYKADLQNLITKYPESDIPETEVLALQKQIDSELSGNYSNQFIESLKQSLADQITTHKKLVAEKAGLQATEKTRKDQSAEAKRNFNDNIAKALAENPNIEKDIDALSKRLNVLLQVPTLDSAAVQTGYDQAITELSKVHGMNAALLESVKRQWDGMRKTAEDLLPVQTLVGNYLAKTDTPITESAAGTIITLLNTVPDLNNAQRKVILEEITKRFVDHNKAIEGRAKNPSATPPPLPSKAAKIEVKGAKIGTAPEVAASDPDFNKKVDYLDETASKLLQSMSNSSASDLIDADAFTKLLVAELKKQNLKTDSKEAAAWLSAQQETVYQINQGIESINQENETKRKALEKLKLENERVHETTANCHQDIDTLLDSPDCSTLEEIAAIQAKINTLPDSPEKTDLQNRLTEIEAHDQAVLKADELIQNALAAKVETSTIDLKIAIQTLLPATAGEHYWKVAEELIDEHNKQFQNLSEPETGTEDQTKIDALVNECNDKVSAILISGELASIADIAALQTKIDSIADTDIKTGLQKNISELLEYNQALKQADTLMETALATKTLIDGGDLKKNLEKLIPTAIEQYWNAAEEIITEHNTSLSVAPSPSPDAVATVVDVPVVTPPQTPDATIAQASETVISTPPVTPDQTPPAAVTVISGTPIVTPDTAPQADVLGVAPVDTKVAAPVDVLNKVDATPLSAEQIAKRDEMFSLIEKNLILTEEEKGQMMVKVMELLRTANRGTNVMDELQKLMTSQDRHQEIQRQLNEKSPIFAMIVQDAVQSALNTNDLNYKSNEAEYQKMLSDLPTDAAKKAMHAVYDAAIGDKTLRGDLKAIQAKVEQVLTNQANFSDARNESLQPLFKRMNVIVKTGLPRESQVLGSQTVAPDVGQWEAPPTDEQPESLRDKAKRKFLELFDRIRGKKPETVEAETDTTNDLDEAYIKTPTEIIDNLVEGNADLTTAEKADLKATALELLEKGTDISKTVEKLKATLAERSRVNREISALVLNAPELSKQMYFALSAALNDEMSAPKRTEALTQWQSFVDQLPTDRAKAAVKAVYQEALKNKALRSDVNALEEKIADKLASTGIDDREKALNSLINTLGSEINRAISTRKPSETVADQAPAVTEAAVAEAAVVAAAEVLTDAPKTSVENKDAKLNQALTDRISSLNLNSEGEKRDVTPQEFFGSDMDQLIKTMEVENDQNLNTELKAIRQLLVDSKPGVMIGTEATDRLKAALNAKYPEVLDNIMGYINIHIQEHDIRTAMQAEINAKGTELKAKIDTLSSADVSAEIKALHQKFASRINPFGVDQALFPLNDALQERVHNTEAAVKEIDQLWQRADEPSLALNTVATILSKNQLDNTIQLSLIEFAKKIAPIFSKSGEISKEDLGNIIFQIIPQTTNLNPALRSALVNKMKVMVNTHNKTVGQNPQQQVA